MEKYLIARKAGKCLNGAHRDTGVVIHIVPGITENDLPSWDRAFCGAEPAVKRGAGWTASYVAPNCEKCIKKHEASRPSKTEPFFQ